MPQKLTTQEFIEKAKKIHGDTYDYSKVKYVNNNTKVCIICHEKDENGKEHGEFWQTPYCHIVLKNNGCKKCRGLSISNAIKDTLDEFIEKARNVHGDKYDYSNVEYVNSKTKICIICSEHGEFWQTPASHLTGNGCKKCASKKLSKYKRSSKEEFIEKAKRVHGDKYDYSKVEYKTAFTKVCIICPNHGEFWQTPNTHLSGGGCQKCYDERRSLNQRSNTEEFIEKAKKVHGDKYDYSKVEYVNCNTNICIICPKHGEFWQRPDHHLTSKAGCPLCRESHNEEEFDILLKTNNINFEREKTFDWLQYQVKQHLDFFIPELNLAIECQGRQHFEPVSIFGGEEAFKKTVDLDKNKFELCKNHNITIFYFGNKKYKNNCLNEHYYSNKQLLINDIKDMLLDKS